MTDEPLLKRFGDYKGRLDAEGAWNNDALRNFLNREGIDNNSIDQTDRDFHEMMLGQSAGAQGRQAYDPEKTGFDEIGDFLGAIKSFFLDTQDTGNSP
jgi:hypothetical protein